VDRGTLVRDASGVASFATAGSVAPVAALELPATLKAVLAVRIDRLMADDKALLQCLAVLGAEFTLGLARIVSDRPPEEIQDVMTRLGAAELIYERPAVPEASYTFKHALTQEVAYDSLSVERRRELHRRAARAIETLSGHSLAPHYSVLAHHYFHAGMTELAVEYLGRAGSRPWNVRPMPRRLLSSPEP